MVKNKEKDHEGLIISPLHYYLLGYFMYTTIHFTEVQEVNMEILILESHNTRCMKLWILVGKCIF